MNTTFLAAMFAETWAPTSEQSSMEPIPVKSHPVRQSFDSIEDAIAHAMSHPSRRAVEADAEKIKGTTLVDAYWSLSEFALQFSNGKWLHIFIADANPSWQLMDHAPALEDSSPRRIGAAPVQLDWQNFIGVRPMDVSQLIEKRLGETLTKLFINHTGFFVYFRGHLVFQFHAAFRTDTGRDLLFVIEDD